MRILSILTALGLICFSVACSSSDTVDTDAPPAEMPMELDEEPVEEAEEAEETEEAEEAAADEEGDELDLSELIDQQIAACNELVCDRPFECIEKAGDEEAAPDFTAEQCSEIYCDINREALEVMDHTESLQTCLKKDAQLTECLQPLSCDDMLAFVNPAADAGDTCAEEIAAQEDACAPYWAQAEELRMERMSQ